jgi:hypothetical protein
VLTLGRKALGGSPRNASASRLSPPTRSGADEARAGVEVEVEDEDEEEAILDLLLPDLGFPSAH